MRKHMQSNRSLSFEKPLPKARFAFDNSSLSPHGQSLQPFGSDPFDSSPLSVQPPSITFQSIDSISARCTTTASSSTDERLSDFFLSTLNTPQSRSPLSPGVVDMNRKRHSKHFSISMSPPHSPSADSTIEAQPLTSGVKHVSIFVEKNEIYTGKKNLEFFTSGAPSWVVDLIDKMMALLPNCSSDKRFLRFLNWCFDRLLDVSPDQILEIQQKQTGKNPLHSFKGKERELTKEEFHNFVNEQIKYFLMILIENHKKLHGLDLSELDLNDFVFPNDVTLNDVKFIRSNLNHVTFLENNMIHCNFQESILCDVHFEKCNLLSSNFSSANLSKTEILSSDLSRSSFLKTVVSNSNFSGSKLNSVLIQESNFKDSNLSYSSINNAKIQNTKFENTHARGLILEKRRPSGAIFSSCHFIKCNISQSSLIGSSFTEIKFENTKCIGTNFGYCEFRNISVFDSNFSCSNFFHVDDTSFLLQTEQDQIFFLP